MAKLADFYYKNIYSIIWTLAFHIVLFLLFLIADLSPSIEFRDEGIIVELVEMEEMEIPKEESGTESTEQEDAPYQPLSNRAVNKAIKPVKDDFFDEAYQKEIEDAQKLVEDVNEQLEKEIPAIDDLEMPEVTNEASTDNVVNYGESRNTYFLKGRYHTRFPIPTYLAETGGVITVDIVVNPKGKVISATVRNKENHPQLAYYAQQAALRTRFNQTPQAPAKQTGTITYTFIKQ